MLVSKSLDGEPLLCVYSFLVLTSRFAQSIANLNLILVIVRNLFSGSLSLSLLEYMCSTQRNRRIQQLSAANDKGQDYSIPQIIALNESCVQVTLKLVRTARRPLHLESYSSLSSEEDFGTAFPLIFKSLNSTKLPKLRCIHVRMGISSSNTQCIRYLMTGSKLYFHLDSR